MEEGQKGGKEKKKKTRWKRGEEEKRDGRSLCERGRIRCGRKEERKKGRMRCGKRRKEGRENEGEGEREEMRGRERRTENRESGTRNVSPSPDTFPSTKLGNNMTPIKGRLGKNTTPTSKGPTKLNQNLQRILGEDDQASTLHLTQITITHQKGQSIQSINSIAMKPLFIRRPKHSEIRAIVQILHKSALKTLASFQENQKSNDCTQ